MALNDNISEQSVIKMKLAIILIALIACAAASPILEEWEIFKREHGKTYQDDAEEQKRMDIFFDTLAYIDEHNRLYASGQSTYKMGMNQFGDMTEDEVNEQMSGARVDDDEQAVEQDDERVVYYDDSAALPAKVDWRKKGVVTPVKNQGQCGSCWAFSATGSLESAHALVANSTLVSLSESNLVDCSRPYGNHGCQGGLPDRAFRYIEANRGVDTEHSYPYKPVNGRCHFHSNSIGATMSDYKDVHRDDEMALQQSIATAGPVSVCVYAMRSFQMYHSGVYYEPNCPKHHINHAILAVGYDTTDDGSEYYIVKNSWGTRWGMNGYIWMSRNRNSNCAIAYLASYPVV